MSPDSFVQLPLYDPGTGGRRSARHHRPTPISEIAMITAATNAQSRSLTPLTSTLTGSTNSTSTTVVNLSGDIRKTQADPHAMAGFSDVYRGIIESSKLPVAIKMLRAVYVREVDFDPERARLRVLKRLEREMRVWQRLRHRRIAPLLGYAFIDGIPCLISQWCKNGNVLEYLRRYPRANRQLLILEVAEGLVYLHTQRPVIVHSDLKARNVLVSDQGEAMLCDFGLSKLMEDAPSGFTTSFATGGTLRWIAPELLNGEVCSTKSDVYSFACLALEIMTGRPPYVNLRTDSAVMNALLLGITPSPIHYPELPPTNALWRIFGECWRMEPYKRPSMEEVYAKILSTI